jgi:peptidoglycan-N-acetylglucosamine deacetylase
MSGVSHKNSLERLTLADIESDIDEASRQLEDALGTKPRVFAYPCGQTFVGRGVSTQSYVPVIARKFLVGRTFNDVWGNGPLGCDLAQVAAINSDAMPTNQLREPFEDARTDGSWIVLGGHEIGGAGRQTTFPETIEAVVRWCRGEGVWIGTVGAIGETVEHMQRGGVTQAGPRSIPPAPSMRP